MKLISISLVSFFLVHTSNAFDSPIVNRTATVNTRTAKTNKLHNPMYRIIKPISDESPPKSFPVITHPFPPIYASSNDKNLVVPTNSWLSNLFYSSTENLAPTTPDPYILRLLDDFGGTLGLSISQPDEKVIGTYPPQNNVPETKAGYIINGVVVDFRVTAKEFENKKPKQKVTRWDLFGSDVQLESPDDPQSNIKFPLSRGMPFVTSKYNNLTPKFFTQHAIIKVEADKNDSKDTYSGKKFKLSFNNNPGSTFIIYVLGDQPLTFEQVGLNNFVANSKFTGVIQVAKLPKPEHESLLDSTKGVWATGGKIDADISNDVVSTYTISWTKDGDTSKELLTYAYPHHLTSFVPDTVKTTNMILQSASKGPMQAVTGNVWKLQETELNKVRWFPHQPAPEESTRNEIMEHMVEDINSNYTEHTLKDDNYFSGKGLQKFALIALLLNKPEKTELRNPELAQRALDKIKEAIDPYLDNKQTDPFLYDDLYKGIVATNGLPVKMGGTGDVNAAFGHSYYNDHHYHQGYLIVAAAIIHYLDPKWRSEEIKSWTEALIRDVNTPVDTDPYFAQFRSWDWFAGHSWAGGIKVDGALDGRDQESVPESINFYWGTKLWGLATKNKDMTRLANLQLAVSKRTTYEYFWMLDGNKNRPAEMVKNKVAGIYFEQKIDYTTYFGRYLEFIHGIQQLPMTPMLSEYIRTPEFVTEEWDQKLSAVAPTVDSPWAGVLYSNYAIIKPGDAYPKLRSVLMDDGQTRSYSLYLAATKPNFVRRAISKLTKPNLRAFKPMQLFDSVNLVHPDYPQDKYPPKVANN